MANTQFDWYRLSLINQEKPDIEKLQQIIRNGNISKGIERVPTTYRKNLLIMYQNASNKLKYQTKSIISTTNSLEYRKNTVADCIQQMQRSLQNSKNQLVILKSTLTQKKKMSKKLKQKIQTLKKNKGQQVYFCPLCSRNDFSSRQIFTFHMFSQHQTYKTQQDNNIKLSMPNNSFSSSANNQLKDFIMTLKDKQMEMMKMILSQKKQFQTQELQKLYDRQMKLMTMKNNSEPQYLRTQGYNNNRREYEDYSQGNVQLGTDNDELKGQSQFLFYQKSEQYKKAAQKQQYSLKKAIQQQRKRQAKKHSYYDIFKDMEQNKSIHQQDKKLQIERTGYKNQIGNSVSKNQYEQEHFSSQSSGGQKILQKFSFKSTNDLHVNNVNNSLPQGIQPLKMTSTNLKYEQFNPSITDRLKQQERKNNHNNSIYSNFRKTTPKGFIQNAYVFNSGPLIDDNAGNSDYEDYFGEEAQKKIRKNNQTGQFKKMSYNQNSSPNSNKSINQKQLINQKVDQHSNQHNQSMIQDEQIKLNPGSYSFVSKSTFSKQNISQFLSPNREDSQNNSDLQTSNKNKYNKYHNIHQKSSEIVDLSDSFSKKDFSLSKDQQSINLSDLKLSKLQKKRAQEKEKQKYTPSSSANVGNYPTYGKNSQFNESQQNQLKFNKKPKQYVLISQEKPLNIHSAIQEPKITLLMQFQKKIQTVPAPLIPSSYNFQKKQNYQFNQFYKRSLQQSNKFPTHNNSKFSQLNGLNEFVRGSGVRNQNVSPNIDSNPQQRAVSPQQFFVNEMKKQPSFNSLNQNNSNQQFGYKSIPEKEKIDLPQKSQYSNSIHRSLSSSQTPGFSKSQSQQGRSSSRQRKKFQPHSQLENSNQGGGILNQFFKREFNSSSQNNQNPSKNSQQVSKSMRRSQSYQNSQKHSNSQKQQNYEDENSRNNSSYNKEYYYKNSNSQSSGNGVLQQFIK